MKNEGRRLSTTCRKVQEDIRNVHLLKQPGRNYLESSQQSDVLNGLTMVVTFRESTFFQLPTLAEKPFDGDSYDTTEEMFQHLFFVEPK